MLRGRRRAERRGAGSPREGADLCWAGHPAGAGVRKCRGVPWGVGIRSCQRGGRAPQRVAERGGGVRWRWVSGAFIGRARWAHWSRTRFALMFGCPSDLDITCDRAKEAGISHKIGWCLPKTRRAGAKTRLTGCLCLLVTSSTHNLDGSEELLRAVRIAIPVNYGRASSIYRGGRGVGCDSRRPVSPGLIFVLVATPIGLSVPRL